MVKPTDRILFNWGFWDGRAAFPLPAGKRQRAYCAGYDAGRMLSFANDSTSDAAWRDYQNGEELRRKQKRVLPETRTLRI